MQGSSSRTTFFTLCCDSVFDQSLYATSNIGEYSEREGSLSGIVMTSKSADGGGSGASERVYSSLRARFLLRRGRDEEVGLMVVWVVSGDRSVVTGCTG